MWAWAARRRDALISRAVDKFPAVGKGAKALPAKTFTFLTLGGTLSVIFATEPRITFWTFGAMCCAIASSCLTLGLRAPVDEDIVATFSPIMLGTLRQKMRTLHIVLQSLGAIFAYLGASMIAAARAHDDSWHWAAAVWGIFATAHDALSFAAVLLLSLQLADTIRGDDDETVGHFAHDTVCFAQITTLLAQGLPSMSTFMVAASVFVLWFSNAIQVHMLYTTPAMGNDDGPILEAPIKFSV